MNCTLFKNACLIDGNGGEMLENVSLLVNDGIIVEISNKIQAPSSADIIDCQGNTIMPGLIDAHMHLGLVEIEVANLARRNAPGLMAARMFKNLREALGLKYAVPSLLRQADTGMIDYIPKHVLMQNHTSDFERQLLTVFPRY